MAQLNFDATQVAPDAGRECVPEDWYDLQVTGSEIKATNGSAGPGAQLVLEVSVISGKFANRKMWQRFNINNPNAEAVRIGYAQLSAICHAVDVLQLAESQQLHGIPFKGKVKIRKGGVRPEGGNYDDQNEIAVYKHRTDPQPTNTVANAPALPGAAAAMPGGGAPSWAAQPAAAAPVAAPAAAGAPTWAGQPAAPAAAPVAAAVPVAAAAPAAAAPATWTPPAGGADAQWANGSPTQPAAAAPAAAAAAPAQPDHPAVAAAQAAQPPFVAQPTVSGAPAGAAPIAVEQGAIPATAIQNAAPNVGAAPVAEGTPSWAAGGAPAAETPSWAK